MNWITEQQVAKRRPKQNGVEDSGRQALGGIFHLIFFFFFFNIYSFEVFLNPDAITSEKNLRFSTSL